MFRREVQGCDEPFSFLLFHLFTCGSVIHAGYCFLPDLSAEMADEANEDSRCSQAPQQHTESHLLEAADGARANANHPAPVQSAPKESAPPIPAV